MRFAFLLATAFAVASATPSLADEPESEAVEIPLEEIWALDMPGTRPLTEIEPGRLRGNSRERHGPLTQEIRRALGTKRETDRLAKRNIIGERQTPFGPQPIYSDPPKEEDVGPGFAVVGIGRDALNAAHAVLVKDQKRSETLSGPVSLVLYSLIAGVDVCLDTVTRNEFAITLRYHLETDEEPFSSGVATSNFALIPLGPLRPGKYDVAIERRPGNVNGEEAIAEAVICEPFSFEVK
jgi:hypothetical protein